MDVGRDSRDFYGRGPSPAAIAASLCLSAEKTSIRGERHRHKTGQRSYSATPITFITLHFVVLIQTDLPFLFGWSFLDVIFINYNG